MLYLIRYSNPFGWKLFLYRGWKCTIQLTYFMIHRLSRQWGAIYGNTRHKISLNYIKMTVITCRSLEIILYWYNVFLYLLARNNVALKVHLFKVSILILSLPDNTACVSAIQRLILDSIIADIFIRDSGYFYNVIVGQNDDPCSN